MANVDKINDQISTLKQEAKKLTEESKNISLEEEKVNKMINTFKAQKV
jgi:regulator of replication initiation timing